MPAPGAGPDEETRAIIFDAARHQSLPSAVSAATRHGDGGTLRWRVSTKTLYRLISTKAALFEGTVTARIDSRSVVNLSTCEHQDIEVALQTALLVCADLVLHDEVIALYRMMLAGATNFPTSAKPSIRRRCGARLRRWPNGCACASAARIDQARQCR